MSGIRPIKAYAVVKNNKLSAIEIYDTKDIVLDKKEKLVRVIISIDEENTTKKKRKK